MSTSSQSVAVVWRNDLFVGEVRRRMVAPQSVAAIIAELEDELPPLFHRLGEVRINSQLVPREAWSRVTPKPSRADRPVVMTLHVEPGDGGTLRTVAAIGILLAATAVSGGAAAPLLGSFFASGIGAALLGAGVGIGGSLALAALAPPPSLADAPAASSIEQATLASAGLQGNASARGAAIPISIGTNRVAPLQLCEPLIERVGDDEYAECLYGLAGPHQIEDLRAGDTAFSNIAEIQSEVLESGGSVSLISRHGRTEGLALEVSQHAITEGTVNLEDQVTPANSLPKWHAYRADGSPDEIWFNLDLVEGVFYTQNPTLVIGVPIRMRVRQAGAVSWLNLPELHYHGNKAQLIRRSIRLKWLTAPSLPTPPTNTGFAYAYKLVPTQTFTPVGSGGWTADTWFSAGAGNNLYSAGTVGTTNVRNVALYSDRADIFLGGASFPQGDWELELIVGQPYSVGVFTASTYVRGGGPAAVIDFFGYWTNAGLHRADNILNHFNYKVSVPAVSRVWNSYPIETAWRTSFAQIAVKVHNRQLESISCLASALVPIWNGSAWTGASVSKNPAAHVRNILRGPLNRRPLTSALLPDASLTAFWTHCVNNALECNAVLAGRSVREAARLIAAAGYAHLRESETYGIIIDKSRAGESPIQVFSPRVISGLAVAKPFIDRPDGLRVRYRNEADDYKEAEFIVLDPDASADDRLEEVSYDALTKTALVTARADFDIAQSKLRLAQTTFRSPARALICTRGDLVALQHDVIDVAGGFARIASIARSGGKVQSITVDGSVPGPNSTGAIGIAVLLTDGTWWTQPLVLDGALAEARILTFSPTPSLQPSDPGSGLLTEDCDVVTGKVGSEYGRYLVHGIRWLNDLDAEVTLVAEAPELFA